MPTTTPVPVRWHAEDRLDGTADVLLPVERTEPADDWRNIESHWQIDPVRIYRDTEGPGNRHAPPGTVGLARVVIDQWAGRIVGETTLRVPLLRLSAADYERIYTTTPYATRAPVTDLHTGAPWHVGPFTSEPFGHRAPVTADPAPEYTIRTPPEWGSTRHDETYVILDRLTGEGRIGDSRRALADAPLARWSVIGPYRDTRP